MTVIRHKLTNRHQGWAAGRLPPSHAQIPAYLRLTQAQSVLKKTGASALYNKNRTRNGHFTTLIINGHREGCQSPETTVLVGSSYTLHSLTANRLSAHILFTTMRVHKDSIRPRPATHLSILNAERGSMPGAHNPGIA